MVHDGSSTDRSRRGHAVASRGARGLTRRRVLGAGAAAGGALWLGVAPAVAGAARGTDGTRRVRVPRARLRPGRVVALRPGAFELVGGSVAALAGSGIEVRARRRGGRWTPWTTLAGGADHAPDGRRAAMGDPLWVGDSDLLQLRARRLPARDLDLALVGLDARERRRTRTASARAAASRAARPRATATGRAAMPAIIPRSAWASGVATKGSPSTGQVQLAFVHHTVNGNDYQPEDSAGIVRAIAKYHIGSNGWNDIGYNFLVDRFGQIFEGRAGGVAEPIVGAQAVGWNSVSTGIAIIGTFEQTAPPEAALNAVAALVRWKLPLHGAPTAGTVSLVSSGGAGNRWPRGREVAFNRVSGHRDGCSTDCPGTSLYGLLPALRAKVGDAVVAPTRQLTLSGPESVVAYGKTLTASGRLTIGGAGLAGEPVVLEKRSPSGGWVPLGTATTDGAGRWRLGTSWRRSADLRARAGDTVSDVITPPIVPSLSLRSPASRVRKGRTLRVSGRVRGSDRVRIMLRRRYAGGRYKLVAERTITLDGSRFATRIPVRRTGLHRVTLQATSGGRRYDSAARYTRAIG